jgi:uncharacterized membrane protein (UPF0136 family)
MPGADFSGRGFQRGQNGRRFQIMNPNTILWIYIVLLVVGGLIGYLKAKSKISLYMSVGFAAVLTLTRIIPARSGDVIADVIMGVLLIVFAIRLVKTKRFMPAGMMLVLTILMMAARHLV